MKAWIDAGPIARLTLGCNSQCLIQELQRTPVSLLLISLLKRIRKFQKSLQTTALTYQQISEMR